MARCAAPANTIKATDLMAEITSNSVNGRDPDDTFTAHMADFSIELFKQGMSNNENSLISPLSVILALAMTANGADGETLAQMITLLGGGITLDDLNEYLYSYAKGLPSDDNSMFHIANSIWFRKESLEVSPAFLQTNADYYSASAYSSVFDEQTVTDINHWVKTNTNGTIESILSEISADMMMYLINAVAFKADWQNQYYEHNVRSGSFTNISGERQSVSFMSSREFCYLDDGMATGFIKPYVGGYSFVALLPNENITIGEYIKSLSGAGFLETLDKAQYTDVDAYIPKFEYDYSVKLNDALIALGMPDAFDPEKADFSNIETAQSDGLFVSEVLHKTYITVDEVGTKAGAASMVAMPSSSPGPPDEAKIVRLDRPFVYAIIDIETNLPVFIGTLLSV